MRTDSDLDAALSTLTDAKTAQEKLRAAFAEIDRLRHRKPVEVIDVKATPSKRSDDWKRVIIPDSHGNKISRPAAAAMLRDIKTINPDEIVMLGDHLDCGGFLAQHHVMGYVAEVNQTSYADDVEAANQFLDEIIKAAPGAKIHYLEGNHEARVEKWCVTQSLRHQKDAEFLRNLVGVEAVLKLGVRGIQYYRMCDRYDDLPVPGIIRLGQCLFTHGFSTASAAATAHARVAGTSIVYGHTHRHQSDILRTVSGGVFGAWCPGALAQIQNYYEHNQPNNHSHGYGLQIVANSGRFLHLQIPILDGESLLSGLKLA